ncbi:MAG: fibrobacter succinogenes major paralogous domain-containing protein [Bacteroidales bacterium]|nr:fibrobacter succinogenes major paralogous domain-containing protein [Bacteroidales bacterium]
MIYNGYTATTGNICPSGWHVSTENDWMVLILYLQNNGYGDPSNKEATAFSLASKTGWYGYSSSPGAPIYNPSSNNSTGFNGLPIGFRYDAGGEIKQTGIEAFWWTGTAYDGNYTNYAKISTDINSLSMSTTGNHYGMHIRCVKD